MPSKSPVARVERVCESCVMKNETSMMRNQTKLQGTSQHVSQFVAAIHTWDNGSTSAASTSVTEAASTMLLSSDELSSIVIALSFVEPSTLAFERLLLELLRGGDGWYSMSTLLWLDDFVLLLRFLGPFFLSLAAPG